MKYILLWVFFSSPGIVFVVSGIIYKHLVLCLHRRTCCLPQDVINYTPRNRDSTRSIPQRDHSKQGMVWSTNQNVRISQIL